MKSKNWQIKKPREMTDKEFRQWTEFMLNVIHDMLAQTRAAAEASEAGVKALRRKLNGDTR
jgi:hypothetical protein